MDRVSTLPPTSARRRAALACAAALVLVLGLGVRLLLHGVWTGPAGDALYAVLVYLVVAFVLPRQRSLAVGGVAFAVCAAIELFQLTGLPVAWAQAFPLVRLVLGTTFVAGDLLLYALGCAAAALADAGVRARRR